MKRMFLVKLSWIVFLLIISTLLAYAEEERVKGKESLIRVAAGQIEGS